MIGLCAIMNISADGKMYHTIHSVVDESVNYGSSYHFEFLIPSLLLGLVFNILPPVLLILYPIRAFRSCLSKFYINLSTVHIFTAKIYSNCRNGLHGGQDMRSFSSLYFFLRLVIYFPTLLSSLLNKYFPINEWSIFGTLFSVLSLFTSFSKPYNKPHMNYLDAMLHLHFAILCFVSSTGQQMLLIIARVLLSIPITLFFLILPFIIFKKF